MPYTFAEKALARAAGVSSVRAGDLLDVRPDLVFSHDNSAAIAKIFAQTGAPRIAHPERIAITLDHAVPAPTTAHAQNHAEIRAWVKEQNIAHFFEVGRGICHQVISEEALILPGETIMGADSHTPHFGWLGAFGMGVGRTEVAALWATGELWIAVPESIKIEVVGKLQPGVMAKDMMLMILQRLTVSGGQYRAVELIGEGIRQLPIDERPVIPNMMAEFGAISACIPPDDLVFEYLERRKTREYTPIYADADAVYAESHVFDITSLVPLVAMPHQPDQVVTVQEAAGAPIQQGFIGTCTGGRYEDLAAAARVVQGQQVKARLIIIPASVHVLQQAIKSGVLEILLNAGATITTPGCGPCMGNHMGVPASQEATISTGSRNFKGRMGTNDAPIYLSNAAVVAASALTGFITPPEQI